MSQYTEARKRIAEQDKDPAPSRLAHRCTAAGCPMAGSLADSSHSATWWCVYHHAAHPSDLARITSVLNEHRDLRDIVNHGRRLIVSPDADPSTFGPEWRKLRELLAFGGYDEPPLPTGAVDTFNGWLYRIEVMLGGKINRAMGVRRKAA